CDGGSCLSLRLGPGCFMHGLLGRGVALACARARCALNVGIISYLGYFPHPWGFQLCCLRRGHVELSRCLCTYFCLVNGIRVRCDFLVDWRLFARPKLVECTHRSRCHHFAFGYIRYWLDPDFARGFAASRRSGRLPLPRGRSLLQGSLGSSARAIYAWRCSRQTLLEVSHCVLENLASAFGALALCILREHPCASF